MKALALAIVLVMTVAVFSGCLGGSGSNKSAQPASTLSEEPSSGTSEPAIEDSDIPLIQENDTVEIGEMV